MVGKRGERCRRRTFVFHSVLESYLMVWRNDNIIFKEVSTFWFVAKKTIHLWQKISESKHVSHVRFTIKHSLAESNTSERNIDSKRQVEPNSMISLQSSLGELEGR
ncbi:hypothetical protein PHAVU_L001642 [Phaseolus vulgaris]|uniref:Uncharacterized protein n=3 Tax=Phaseolus vulgaris TaxID=3885 RepID=A0ACC3NZR9_PHAVU|nr:hypothetical protein PHAVU_L008800g [Phaseolus vulgaris]ESW35872.1 hypothetical protein PHAVU_L008800g [Phaseolus vulgaris]